MAKTVFGIPGADTGQGKSGGAVAPKGVQSVHSGQAIPQKAGNVAIPGAPRGLATKPPAARPLGGPTSAPPPPPAPRKQSTPTSPASPSADTSETAAEQGPVDVQGKTVFGMPAMKIPEQEPQPQAPEPAEVELEPLWPKAERAAVPPITDAPSAPQVVEPIDELSASMLEPELSGDDQVTTPIPTMEPTGEDVLETARMPTLGSVAPPPRTAGWVWALVVAGGLALAVGSGWLVWQMIRGGSGLEIPTVETPTLPGVQN